MDLRDKVALVSALNGYYADLKSRTERHTPVKLAKYLVNGKFIPRLAAKEERALTPDEIRSAIRIHVENEGDAWVKQRMDKFLQDLRGRNLSEEQIGAIDSQRNLLKAQWKPQGEKLLNAHMTAYDRLVENRRG